MAYRLLFTRKFSAQRILLLCCLMSLFSVSLAADPDNNSSITAPFGAQLFSGNFLNARGTGLNPGYVLSAGDHVDVAVWGVVNIKDTFTLDSQGNIFVSEIGPLALAGVKNSQLTQIVKNHIGKIYTGNFDVYTNLVTAQPVALYVTGMVNKPGRYAGLPSDSILFFLDLAGGIDAKLGSYRNISLLRNGKLISTIDLYDFILKGQIKLPQLKDSDTILVHQRGSVVQLKGNVARSAFIEFTDTNALGGDILNVVPQATQANEVTISGMRNDQPISQTMSLSAFLNYSLHGGDVVTLRDDGRAKTILVNIEGEYDGPAVLSVKRGARLVDVLKHIPVDPMLANTEAIFLRRASVARAQKDAIKDSLFRLERSAMLTLSGSSGEVNIRSQEAELVAKFAERARLIDPLGRVVVSSEGQAKNILLQSGDTIVIPTHTQIVRIAGEVTMMHAVTYREGWTAMDYIQQAGGYSARADNDRVIIHHPNAEVKIGKPSLAVGPGDEIIVPPRVDKKIRQLSMDILDVIYKIAISARVAIGL